jgi:hypothetical protein
MRNTILFERCTFDGLVGAGEFAKELGEAMEVVLKKYNIEYDITIKDSYFKGEHSGNVNQFIKDAIIK